VRVLLWDSGKPSQPPAHTAFARPIGRWPGDDRRRLERPGPPLRLCCGGQFAPQ
jgi:hypothetical protein